MAADKFYADRNTRIPRRSSRPSKDDDAYAIPPAEYRHPETTGSPTPRRRRHRRNRRDERANTGRLLWFGLACAVCIYVAFLAVSILRDRMYSAGAAEEGTDMPDASLALPADNPLDDGESQGAPAAEAEPFLEARIREWMRADALVGEAATLRGDGRISEAAERLEAALAIVPDQNQLLLNLARVRQDQQRYRDALDLSLRLLAQEPEHREGRLVLAEVLSASGRYEDALAAAQWMLDDDPYSEAGHKIVADAYTRMGRIEKALPHLNRLVSLNRDNMTARNALGQAYLSLGDLNEALKVFEEVKRMDDSNSQAHFYTAVCYARQEEMAGLTEVMTSAASQFGRDFVLAWVRSPEFDRLRETQEFRMLLKRLGDAPQAIDAEPSSEPGTLPAQATAG
jgi:tetratricopeptide (TPR) repeat protein